jgi:hypothetical protein
LYGILAEAWSDFHALRNLLRSIKGDWGLPVVGKGYDHGVGELLRKAARDIRLYARRGCTRIILCADADGPDPGPIRLRIEQEVVRPAGVSIATCVVVPVQEFESWILADVEKIKMVFKRLNAKPIAHPERQNSPKEFLRRLSRDKKARPRYDPSVHNEEIAKYLDVRVVSRKCPSFRPFYDFVTGRKPT